MVLRLLAAAALLASTPAFAQPVTPEALRRHIDVLASDAYEGREPGTEGERKTIAYISRELGALGFEPAGPEGSWYQPVELKLRKAGEQKSLFQGRKKKQRLELDRDGLILLSRDEKESLKGAPVVFVGYGAPDAVKGTDLKGAVALLLFDAPKEAGVPAFDERVRGLTERGAAAVVSILPKETPWPAIQRSLERGQERLAIRPMPPVQGVMSPAAAEQLLSAARAEPATLLAAAARPGFVPVPLKLKANLDVATEIVTTVTSNVVGRLKGTGGSGEAIMLLGHWDHLGICRPEGEADRICNGAVDNASGIAVMLETAKALAKGPRPKRDILVLATTAEEKGLLGASYFAARPVVPLEKILAAVNVDTVAIAPKGEKVAVIGRGVPALDAAIERTATELGRVIDSDAEADSFVTRQDGWALQRAGIPAVMVGGSFSNMKRLQDFLGGPYHGPTDNPVPTMILGGAAEDADLTVALLRRLADPAEFAPPAREPRPQ
ncbi:MAG TPA: M20/M25/M40 family metallo-hydrolase [Allosphingosinicella sp.]|jgi:Zn-dependent M28 family amino/carboxypeptidase